jgi:putative ubiquitin-RnfH superfamily antitoxin RatB of RatAB toxin-antitoxin module
VAAIKVDVIRAWAHAYDQVELTMSEPATVGEALVACGWSLDGISGYAVFGQCVDTGTRLRDGDRLELLRPLQVDPKDARRRRARTK